MYVYFQVYLLSLFSCQLLLGQDNKHAHSCVLYSVHEWFTLYNSLLFDFAKLEYNDGFLYSTVTQKGYCFLVLNAL